MNEADTEAAPLTGKDRYLEFLLNPAGDTMNREEIAKELGVDRKTIWRWEKGVDWAWIKEERRRRYAREIIDLDKALFKAAKKGNIRAIEIGYQRFDGWVPTTGLVSNQTDSEIEAEMQKIIERKRATADALKATNDAG
ncbi:MAG: hypothetical protein HY078_10420 [Elusimicrobia bacterium]|nr:hypothetical protein [Elusimicrobiota bacterium]